MTKEDEESFKNEKSCHICNKNIRIIIINKLEIMIILQDNIKAVVIENVTQNSLMKKN